MPLIKMFNKSITSHDNRILKLNRMDLVHVFIVASMGIPAKYGGFETFVENLTARKLNKKIQYHVSCMNNEEKHFIYNGVDCFNVKVPCTGALGRILHVSRVLHKVTAWVKEHQGENVVVYILGCRIGPLLGGHVRKLHKLGVCVLCNPDGLEWKRAKWGLLSKWFLRFCEKCLIEKSDLIICDSKNIEAYVQKKYPRKKNMTEYIPYGAEITQKPCSGEKLQRWYREHEISRDGYYLIVGRFVPENNYETIIREFMRSATRRNLVIITNVGNNRFYQMLVAKTGFKKDARIKFVGTVYDAELLIAIRKNAYGYLHGHSVGGTNPSLLEAMASTQLNLLFDVEFNREVAQESALYWTLEEGNLASLIARAETLDKDEIERMAAAAKERIKVDYNWSNIVKKYESVYMNAVKVKPFR